MSDNLIGTIATSKAGRDKGRSLIIVGIVDDEYVLVADGRLRKIVSPKKKKLKHLKVHDAVVESVKTKLTENKTIFDAEIRNYLLSAGFNHDKIDEEEF